MIEGIEGVGRSIDNREKTWGQNGYIPNPPPQNTWKDRGKDTDTEHDKIGREEGDLATACQGCTDTTHKKEQRGALSKEPIVTKLRSKDR